MTKQQAIELEVWLDEFMKKYEQYLDEYPIDVIEAMCKNKWLNLKAGNAGNKRLGLYVTDLDGDMVFEGVSTGLLYKRNDFNPIYTNIRQHIKYYKANGGKK